MTSSTKSGAVLARLQYDRVFARNLLSFFLADNGFGMHQFRCVVWPAGDEHVVLPLQDATSDRLFRIGQTNAVRLYAMLAPALRKRWFEYNQRALRAVSTTAARYTLDVTWHTFDTQIMPAFIQFDLACRLNPRDTFAHIFNKPISSEQEHHLLAGRFVSGYHDGVHAYIKWLAYRRNSMALVRNTPTFRPRFLAHLRRNVAKVVVAVKTTTLCRLLVSRVDLKTQFRLARVCKAWYRVVHGEYGLSLSLESVFHRDQQQRIMLDPDTKKKLVWCTRLRSCT